MKPSLYPIDEAYELSAQTDWFWLVTDAEDPRDMLDQLGEKCGTLFNLMRQIGRAPQTPLSKNLYRRLKESRHTQWDHTSWQLFELKIKRKGAADVRFYVYRNSEALSHPDCGDVPAFGLHIIVQACDKQPSKKKAHADYSQAKKRIEEWIP